MTDSSHTPLIAIDGGGTSCRFALQGPAGTVTVRRGSANVYSAPEAALNTLRSGLADLAREAGLDMGSMAAIPAYAGLAGIIDAEDAEAVAAVLPLDCIRVEDDRPAAVAGALGARDGSLIGFGTGSFLARQFGGQIRLAGGYGFQVGDEGSGAWLGKRLLQRCLHVLDGIAEETPLKTRCLEAFGGQASAIVRFAMSAAPGDYGRYAPMVTEAAAGGDPAAVEIMTEGAGYICRVLAALGHRPGDTLCMAGSVAPHYREFLPEGIASGLSPSQGVALDGALALARRYADELERGLS
jgi:glucosamine kinase